MSVENFPAPAGEGLTVALIVESYLALKRQELQCARISLGAVEKAERYCRAFSRDFGAQLVSQCRRGDLRRFLAMHPEYRSPHTQHDAAGAVVTCFRWAEEDGLIAQCPYRKPANLPVPEPRQPASRDEVRKLLLLAKRHSFRKRARVRFRLLVWFCWQTGCRTCEARRLVWDWYDDARGVFTIPHKTQRKTGCRRLLVLSKRAWRMIRWLWRWQGKATSGVVFVNERGQPFTKDRLARQFRLLADLAGVRPEVSAYSLRHGFCCEKLEAGCGERQVADILGHASTRYVGWYGRGVQGKVEYLRGTADKEREPPMP